MYTYQKFRSNGATGALLDEYEKAINELQEVISLVSDEEMIQIVDKNTEDEDCVSIQSVLSHVIGAGYNYAVVIRKWKGESIEYKKKEKLDSIRSYQKGLKEMFKYNVKLFEDYPEISLTEHNPSKKIKVRWGQYYDVEQLFEHAIVHILRHRRQIVKFRITSETGKSDIH